MKNKKSNNPNKGLFFLYNTAAGRIILKPLVKSKFISSLSGKILSSSLSKILIKPFIKNNNINMDEYESVKYKSFNDFFTRNIKPECRKLDSNSDNLLSPCDSNLTHYKINDDLIFEVKNTKYTIASLINDERLAKEYINGDVLVFRLAPDNYHHYKYIDDGKLLKNYRINGKFHSVNPIVYDKYEVFKENSREISILKTNNFDKMLYIEVGALLVGKMKNLEVKKFIRGDEKGYFEYGGSTVILVFKKDIINLDKKILLNSKKGIETYVKCFEKIGKKSN